MAKIVDMPKLSPTMEEGQLTTWHKKEGDAVVIDDLLAEVETDKATMEFRSFDTGTILKILVPAGSIVKLGQPVAIIGKAGEDVSALAPASAAAPAPAAAAPAAAAVAAPAAAAPVAAVAPPPQAAAVVSTDDRVRASPYVRKLARERDLDLHGVAGSGPAGRVIARDLDAIAARPAPAAVAAPTGARPASERRPLSMMRKTIARRLVESKRNVPHFYLTIDVDAGALSALRETINADLAAGAPKGETPEKISINDLLIRAVAMGLARVPECNAQFEEDAIVIHHRVDVSVAVAVAEGLVTPVVRDADRKGVLAIAREVRALAGRARDKKLKPEEMTDGTFSISNLGMFGIDEFSAVINPPEGAILAVGRVRDEPVVQGGAVVPGKRLSMTLSCDHRVIDGAVGARFLAELRKLVEHPTQLLLS
jgi:pyruvate dehydrogenase E2 component (dihydrolipoamide acetyltransferase)